ncbi:hypothetical protein CXF72_11655 [Psychromonas sp. MB-3u-54]|nr:hypothetical protein CXF72_11655 [Psychromonas sp. MB-3u-54]
MFDCIRSYEKEAKIEFSEEKNSNFVRNIEDINRINMHYHEFIHEAFGCDVNDIDEHNTNSEWNYKNRAKYTQKDIDEALRKKMSNGINL